MEYLSQKKGFLGYDANQNVDPKVVVVPFGLEKTVSYGGGTKNGPKEIIRASHQVELFDEELNKEPYKEIGIKTLKPFSIKNKIKSALDQLSKINEDILSSDKFPSFRRRTLYYTWIYQAFYRKIRRNNTLTF